MISVILLMLNISKISAGCRLQQSMPIALHVWSTAQPTAVTANLNPLIAPSSSLQEAEASALLSGSADVLALLPQDCVEGLQDAVANARRCDSQISV